MRYRIPKAISVIYTQNCFAQDAQRTYLHCLPAQNEEGFCSLSQESGELVYQNMFDLICLLYTNADPNTINTRLNENLFILITGNSERVEQDLGRTGGLYFWDIMSLRCL